MYMMQASCPLNLAEAGVFKGDERPVVSSQNTSIVNRSIEYKSQSLRNNFEQVQAV